MAKPINLNKARKARARAEKRSQADQNAVKYGRSKSEKAQEAAERSQSVHRIDQHKLDKE